MFEFSTAEVVGYFASVLVVVSLAMTSLLKLRILNLAGAVTFAGYGLLIGSVPIVLTNIAIITLNVVFLARTARIETFFRTLEASPGSAFAGEFLRFYQDDIARFNPGFSGVTPGDSVVWILRDSVPVGIVVGREQDKTFVVGLDYVIKQYRDFKAGRWLYGPGAGYFKQRGLNRIEATAQTNYHRRFLRKMGFQVENGRFVLHLA